MGQLSAGLVDLPAGNEALAFGTVGAAGSHAEMRVRQLSGGSCRFLPARRGFRWFLGTAGNAPADTAMAVRKLGSARFLPASRAVFGGSNARQFLFTAGVGARSYTRLGQKLLAE